MNAGRFLRLCSSVLLLFVCSQGVRAQPDAKDLLRNLTVKVVPADSPNATPTEGPLKVRRNQVVTVIFTATPKPGHHTYPVNKRTAVQEEAFMSNWNIVPSQGIVPLWPISETEPEFHDDVLGIFLEHLKPFTWKQDILITEDAPEGKLPISITLKTQVCDKELCHRVKEKYTLDLDVVDTEALKLPDALKKRLAATKPEIIVVPVPGAQALKKSLPPRSDVLNKGQIVAVDGTKKTAPDASEGLIKVSHEQYQTEMDAIGKQIEARGAGQSADLLGFMLAGVFWGAISLVTPCVFPMIPITVSYFLHQSEKEHHRPIVMASVYSLTIVIVLTLAAAFLLSIFRMLSINPYMNYFIGGLFIFFALSLFGMYEIELPRSLAQFTSEREGRGGLAGTIFMALTFTIISFACVAPFLGGFGGTAAGSRPLWHNLMGGLAFSVTFASPFFFLALFPVLLRQLPKSGSWLNVVKVVMGFLELAAAFKFFRTAELIKSGGVPSLFTFDFVLGLWVVLCVLCALYLIGVFHLPHDTPEEHVTVPRLLFSAAFLGLAIYLAPALFKVNSAGHPQRPGGAIYAWVDAFLLPESHEGDAEVPHTANLPYAIEQSRKEYERTGKMKRIFVDFTGVTCTNCKINEKNVFSKTQIATLFEPYLFVKMYTDTVPPSYYAADVDRSTNRLELDAETVNLPFQRKLFQTEQLPLYAVLEPQPNGTIKIIGIYDEGRINSELNFADFLKNPAAF